MRRYRLATYVVLAALPFTVLAACQSGNSGSPAPAAQGGSGSSTTSAPSTPDSSTASGGGGSNGSFCQQFTKTHADLVAAVQNGSLSAGNAEAEIRQTINAAPSDVLKSVTEILNVQYDILAKDPQGPQERQNPAYIQAEQAYLAWSKTNC